MFILQEIIRREENQIMAKVTLIAHTPDPGKAGCRFGKAVLQPGNYFGFDGWAG